ncbi:MAG TPA: redoxin domain-containing protein [Candidatus Deferrimicrobiaceae bacterium]|nr:redoxin domain-containing protein [Candidatus Deferrimicrobiaceae bacterium]
MSARRLAALSLVAAALWTGGAAAQPAAAPPAWKTLEVQAYEPPRPAPAFALPALDGRTVRLEDQKGKALLLFFWATW